MNIGITIGFKFENESIWINGIKLNAIYLADALMRSPKKYNVWIINTSVLKVSDVKIPWDTKKYPIFDYVDVAEKIDLLIMLGTSFNKDSIKKFKSFGNKDKKVVSYKCGNNYVIDMENALFPKENKPLLAPWSEGECDDVWFVPQQEYQNKHYFDVFEYADSKPVPFVWSPMFLDEISQSYKKEGKIIEYTPSSNKKRIVSFEPNNNVVKYAMIPTLIVESTYRKNNSLIDYFVICSGMDIGTRPGFTMHTENLKISKNKILKVDGRYPAPSYLANRTDIVVSHQWENPLNYAYLDALHFNYPLIHNADMIKDGGYFYPGFDIKEGSRQLDYVLNHHDDNLDKYQKKCDYVKTRYMADRNEGIIEIYDKLIENLWNPNNHQLSYMYDWETNLYY